jgi:hypothetical protein
MPTPIFQGNTNVYLQGMKALKALQVSPTERVSFAIGTERSNIFVKDVRKNTLSAVEQILSGNDTIDFADIFNMPAWVEILERNDAIQIDMSECPSQGDFPTLWLGVIRNGRMPVHNVSWEVLKPVENNTTAFAAIARD